MRPGGVVAPTRQGAGRTTPGAAVQRDRMFSAFFIDRPKFAFVLSIVITLAGLISLTTLPVDQFPDITPPVVQVSATYPGANAQVVEATVAQPIEEQVNGVEDMIYLASTSGNDGTLNMQVTFEVGTDPDIAQVNVQNRVALAQPRLPEEVVRQGLSVRKQSTNLLLVINLTSPDGTYDSLYLSNYATINLIDALSRVPGVGQATIFGARDYSMRMWLDASRMASLGISTGDVVEAIREQNVQVAAGQIGARRAPHDQQFQYTIRTQGRLADVDAFENIIVRARPDGSSVRIRDIARVELGPATTPRSACSTASRRPTSASTSCRAPTRWRWPTRFSAEVDRLAQRFPPDLKGSILYDTTRFVDESIQEVLTTLLEALRPGRARRLRLPAGLADDGDPDDRHSGLADRHLRGDERARLQHQHHHPVRPGAVDRHRRRRRHHRRRERPAEAERRAWHRATRRWRRCARSPGRSSPPRWCCSRCSCRSGFIPGITGQLYQQFALTIAVAVLISTINALTLSPALCATVLRPHDAPRGLLFRGFNRGFDAVLSALHAAVVGVLVRRVAHRPGALRRAGRRHRVGLPAAAERRSCRTRTRATSSSTSSCRRRRRWRAPAR